MASRSIEAVFETFQRRGTHLERETPVFSLSFAEDEASIKQWEAFLYNIGAGEDLEFQFQLVMETMREFLSPIYQSVIEENEFFKEWNFHLKEWGSRNLSKG